MIVKLHFEGFELGILKQKCTISHELISCPQVVRGRVDCNGDSVMKNLATPANLDHTVNVFNILS